MQLSQKKKTFSEYFSAVLKSRLRFKNSQKKNMTFRTNVFPKLETPKDVVR